MENIILPLAPKLIVRINNIRMGMVQSFEERRENNLKRIGSIGTQSATSILPTNTRHTLKLHRLLLDPSVFAERVDMHALHGFTLNISNGVTTIIFSGCEFSLLNCRYESAQVCVEEAEITAASRSLIV